MKKAIKKFIKELQESSEERKTRWLYGGSAVVFVFVMVFWVSFIKMEVASSSNPKNINTFATIKLGMESTYNSFIKAVKSENTFEFSKEKYNFVAHNLPPVKILPFPKEAKTSKK